MIHESQSSIIWRLEVNRVLILWWLSVSLISEFGD
jgi:hypothetical protein